MHTRLIRVGNSQGLVLPKKLLKQYRLAGEVDLVPTSEGLLIKPVAARQGWDEQFQAALSLAPDTDGELLEGFADTEFEDTEWQW